jgi:uncharacterized protein YprB with RNaseH-like and TPR domain
MLLTLCEESNRLCFFDIECTGLNPDYNSMLVVSVLPFKGKPTTFTVNKPGKDRKLVAEAAAELAKYYCWVSFYGKLFDVKFIDGRLLIHSLPELTKRHHADMYWHLRSITNTSRRSQAHYLRWFELDTQKMDVSPDGWNKVIADPKGEPMSVMKARCESDVQGLKGLYLRTRDRIREVTR